MVRQILVESPSLLLPDRSIARGGAVGPTSNNSVDETIGSVGERRIMTVPRPLFWNLSDPLSRHNESQLYTQPALPEFAPASVLCAQARVDPVRDLTNDGDVESNPGPSLRFGRPISNARGPYIMSLHEAIEEVDNWVWELAFRSDQRVISTPIRLWSLLRLAVDDVLGMWL